MPEPGDSDALIRAKLGVERAWNRRGLERGEVAQRHAAPPPRLGRRETGGEFLDDRFGFGDPGGGDALDAPGDETGLRIAGERALCGGEFLQLGGVEQKY